MPEPRRGHWSAFRIVSGTQANGQRAARAIQSGKPHLFAVTLPISLALYQVFSSWLQPDIWSFLVSFEEVKVDKTRLQAHNACGCCGLGGSTMNIGRRLLGPISLFSALALVAGCADAQTKTDGPKLPNARTQTSASPSASLLTKAAIDPISGAPLTGPIPAGTTIKYVLSFLLPGSTSAPPTIYPTVTIVDTMSASLTYVPGSLQMPLGWTASPSTPFAPPPTTTFAGSNIGSTPGFFFTVVAGGPTAPISPGGGDGYTPVVAGGRIYGFNHHNTGGTVSCWNSNMTTPCSPTPPASPITTPNLMKFVQSGGNVYYAAYSSGSGGIACYTAAGALCTTPFTTVAPYSGPTDGPIAGVVSSSSQPNDLYIAIGSTVYCLTAPSLTTSCGTAAIASGTSFSDIFFDNSNNRLFVMQGGSQLNCVLIPSGLPCWSPKTLLPTNIPTSGGFVLSPYLTATGATLGVCVHDALGTPQPTACYDSNSGLALTVPPSLASALASSSSMPENTVQAYRLPVIAGVNPNGTRILYPIRTGLGPPMNDGGRTVCFDFATMLPCPGFSTGWAGSGSAFFRDRLSDYGYMSDPRSPRCVYGLGDKGILFRFDAASGEKNCVDLQAWPVPDPAVDFCDGKVHQINWGSISIIGRPANLIGGTIEVRDGITNALLQSIPVGTSGQVFPVGVSYASHPNIAVALVSPAYSGSVPTTNFFLYLSYTSPDNPQICFKATSSCGQLKNLANLSAVSSSPVQPPVAASSQVDLGNASGPNCAPPSVGLLKICKVAGPGIPLGQIFTFNAGSTTVSVPAGPAPSGLCAVGPSLPVGNTVTVSENIPAGIQVSNIDVQPASQIVGAPNLATGTVNLVIGAGVTEATYTNTLAGYIEICKIGGLAGNYSFTVNPGNRGPFVVPSGACSPAIQVPSGQIVIQEAPRPGVVMAGCSTFPATQQGPCNLSAQTSTISVAPGGINTQTVATITNRCLESRLCPPPNDRPSRLSNPTRKVELRKPVVR